MLDINYIIDNIDAVKENCKNRHITVDIDHLLRLDQDRRDFQMQIDELRAERNRKSKGKPSDSEIVKMREVGEKIKHLEERFAEIEEQYSDLLLQVPNKTHPDSPVGAEEDYVIVAESGNIPKFSFEAKDHEELMTQHDLIDFERGAKVTGSKFYFVKNEGVLLNQALLSYGIEMARKNGFTLVETPDMVRSDVLEGSGFNPRGEESQIYEIEGCDLSMIGTAEITMLGYHADEVIDLSDGPKKYAALSHCFRTEGGAYGKANKGLYRVHQFTKLELFIFCKPENSELLHQHLIDLEKEICDGLGLAYRVIDIPTGDLGGPAYRKYDLEAWMVMNGSDDSPLGGYGEITSASNCTDYQARRLNIKHKSEDGKSEFVHTLNGTAVVLSRFPVAIIEQFQQDDGSIKVPEVLQKVVGKKVIG
jgi:seryl-tRNA synthetase